MEPRKLTKEDLDKVRNMEGFPIGKDEDIIALSDAPYYTACPNPFIKEFVKENGTPYEEASDDYHKEPFAADVSEGKSDAVYMAHNYHTKVPYKAIMRYILHYTSPGDVIYDGFCGTGMTGVAAQMCGSKSQELKALFYEQNENWGTRKAILNDLSPIAAFISYNQNISIDPMIFQKEALEILSDFEKQYGWMYETKHSIDGKEQNDMFGPIKGKINYTVWSDIFICPHCGGEIIFSEVAFDPKTKQVKDVFLCPSCGAKIKKKECDNAVNTVYDPYIQDTIQIIKQKPVLINYSVGKKKYEKIPDQADLDLINKTKLMSNPYWVPTNRLPEGGETRRNDKYGITHVHHFYTNRSLISIGYLMDKVSTSKNPQKMRFLFEQIILGMAKISRYVPSHFSQVNQYLSGTLYVGSQVVETSPNYILGGKINKLVKVFSSMDFHKGDVCISTESTVKTSIPDNTIDYIFTDPPFGSNLNYSELNHLWEAWMRCVTNTLTEAIVNESIHRDLLDYQGLMEKCFKEYFRVLKPNRWMTVEFHNSKNAVWNAIQQSLQRAGFIVADVRTLDKKQGTFKQINTTSAVKQDLVISAYKPKKSFIDTFFSVAGSEETVWQFVHQHLEKLPVVVQKEGKIEIIAERQSYLLFDRMVAYHIMRGITVPIDASDFYKKLDETFLKRDSMYFLPDQVNEYDTARIKLDVEDTQLSFAVTNEKTAIEWLYYQLSNPKTYSEIQPKFMQEAKFTDKYEAMPELSVLLEENFLQNEKGQWYIPDITKEADVVKLREKRLLKEFEGYLSKTGKLKLFRTEAIRAGFAKLWTDKNYQLIVDTAERLPEQVIQEDDKLLMYYDISLGRIK